MVALVLVVLVILLLVLPLKEIQEALLDTEIQVVQEETLVQIIPMVVVVAQVLQEEMVHLLNLETVEQD